MGILVAARHLPLLLLLLFLPTSSVLSAAVSPEFLSSARPGVAMNMRGEVSENKRRISQPSVGIIVVIVGWGGGGGGGDIM